MYLRKDYAVMDYDELVAKVIELLQREKRVPYRALKRRFDLDDDYIADLKIDLIEAKRLASDENDRILVWLGASSSAEAPPPSPPPSTSEPAASPPLEHEREPLSYTPKHLAEKIPTSRSALEGERKQVTIRFCDLANSPPIAYDLGQWYATTGKECEAAALYGKAKSTIEQIATAVEDEVLRSAFLQSALVQEIHERAARLGE
jgi:hypothetical protein